MKTAVTVLRIALICLYTAVLGLIGIVLCLLIPGGASLIPVARLWSALVLRTCSVRWVAWYHPALEPSQPCVFVANHQSQFDIPALALAMPSDFRMVAKRELLYIPIFGWALWLAGFVFVDRANREAAVKSLDRAVRKIKKGTSIVVFAEGTRSRDGALLPFKKGGFVLALQAGVPIVPVSIRGGHDILPKGRLRMRPGTIHVCFCEPVDTAAYSLETKDDLIREARRRIAVSLSPPASTVTDPGLPLPDFKNT